MIRPLTRDEILTLLRSHAFGVLATYGGDYPYTSLISFGISSDGTRLLFSTMRDTQKYANILHEARVSVLFDNRGVAEIDPELTYALTVMGSAREVRTREFQELREQFLKQHPALNGFLSQPNAALIEIAPIKIMLVQQFQEVRTFDWAYH
jgi:nitroimidazol reductase NimA-like FMN-containing flavoprotein (pyridoxamine 5'-phosphate oxidase superfamily)